MCQTSFTLINIIIKSIIKSIIYLSFRYDTGISFMILIQSDTFDTVHIPRYKKVEWPVIQKDKHTLSSLLR